MPIPSIISYFKGYLTITVTGKFCERFIQVCAKNDILLWDITRISAVSIRCKISMPSFLKLRKIAKNTAVRIHINIKSGFPFFIQKYKKRKIALFSVIFLLISVIILNQFVWSIEIRGNETVPDETILSALEKSGLKIGTLKSKINQQKIKNDSLLAIPELAWLWADKRGSKIIVDVRENIKIPDCVSPFDYQNVVASKDAIIDTMFVYEGVPVVECGDTVLAGTVLVTGKIPVPAKQFDRYVKASATVLARVWYEKKELFSLNSTTRHETKRKKTQYTLDFGGKKVRLFHKDKIPYKDYALEEKNYSFFNISLSKKTYSELYLEKETLTEESVANFGAKQLIEQIETDTAPNSKRINYDTTHKKINDTTIEVTVRAEYLEDIAKPIAEQITKDSEIIDLN